MVLPWNEAWRHEDKLDKFAPHFLTRFGSVTECDRRHKARCRRRNDRLANGEWTKGVWSRAWRECFGQPPNPPPRLTCSFPAATAPQVHFPSSPPHKLRPSLVKPMHIEPLGSNRIARPLGTGRSPMHGGNPMGSWRRSAHGPQGTAQGNRESAMQGGTPAPSGSLPFQSSGLRRAIVGTPKVHSASRSSPELVGSTDRGISPPLP